MANFNFGVTGQERKALVAAISEILEKKAVYLKTPTYGYQVGNINIDKYGTVTGELPTDLLAELAERGFQAEIETLVEDATPEAEAETPAEPETETMEENAGPEAIAGPEENSGTETDTISITLPLGGWTPESLDNLCRMTLAKEPLIKQALGVDAIPIRVLENGIEFPWFRAEHSNDMMAYAQFLTALATTAKEKKRVTAKPTNTDNMRFSMRVFCIGLGLVGSEYSKIRALMCKPLPGNSGWRYYQNEKTVLESASAPEATDEAAVLPDNAAGDAPADETPSDDEGANVTADNTDTAVDESEAE